MPLCWRFRLVNYRHDFYKPEAPTKVSDFTVRPPFAQPATIGFVRFHVTASKIIHISIALIIL